MSVDANSSAVITLTEAISYTHTFQSGNPGAIKSYFVGINKLNLILAQDNCIGVRIYNGSVVGSNEIKLVLVGVDNNGEDMTTGTILQELVLCPSMCPKGSALMI